MSVTENRLVLCSTPSVEIPKNTKRNRDDYEEGRHHCEDHKEKKRRGEYKTCESNLLVFSDRST